MLNTVISVELTKKEGHLAMTEEQNLLMRVRKKLWLFGVCNPELVAKEGKYITIPTTMLLEAYEAHKEVTEYLQRIGVLYKPGDKNWA
jgi:hypothetical protein